MCNESIMCVANNSHTYSLTGWLAATCICVCIPAAKFRQFTHSLYWARARTNTHWLNGEKWTGEKTNSRKWMEWMSEWMREIFGSTQKQLSHTQQNSIMKSSTGLARTHHTNFSPRLILVCVFFSLPRFFLLLLLLSFPFLFLASTVKWTSQAYKREREWEKDVTQIIMYHYYYYFNCFLREHVCASTLASCMIRCETTNFFLSLRMFVSVASIHIYMEIYFICFTFLFFVVGSIHIPIVIYHILYCHAFTFPFSL